jgi:hypothetical protein
LFRPAIRERQERRMSLESIRRQVARMRDEVSDSAVGNCNCPPLRLVVVGPNDPPPGAADSRRPWADTATAAPG